MIQEFANVIPQEIARNSLRRAGYTIDPIKPDPALTTPIEWITALLSV
jgi:hypothetical protein